MYIYLAALIFGTGLIWLIVYLAKQDATKSARLEALKREIKERERAAVIVDNVRRMSIDSVRDKLKQTK